MVGRTQKGDHLEDKDIRVIFNFNMLYYKNCAYCHYWLGTPVLKTPTDLFSYHEIIVEQKPDLIIETGTWMGGSALYMAGICDNLERGNILTIDTIKQDDLPAHPRITYLSGSSLDAKIFAIVKRAAQGKKVLVVLDSDHSKGHVFKELMLYSTLIQPGGYIIIEDTNTLEVHESLDRFLPKNPAFKPDRTREKFLLTFNPSGYLLRVS